MDPTHALVLTTTYTTLVLILHWLIVIGLGTRILLKRRPAGVSLAWLLVITSVPVLGAIAYLFVGELWLPRKRIERYNAFKATLADQLLHIDQLWDIKSQALPPLARALNAQAHNPLNISAVGGNAMQLYNNTNDCLHDIIQDIDSAKSSVNMLFYIWDSAGAIAKVEQALINAVNRGVVCKILVDSAGSKKFLRASTTKALKSAGIEITEMLPVGRFRFLFKRIDIRNHRKIITIDHHTAYTGSMNMADPLLFGAAKGVGQWVDVMARVQGPASRVLDIIIGLDRAIEKNDDPAVEIHQSILKTPLKSCGQIPLQVVPSGPDQAPRITHDMLLTLIYNTNTRLIITTPYFIPSEAMLTALTAAALRGVQVTLIVPQRVDSKLVARASRSYYQDLLDVGIQIALYKGGLLHAKTVTADNQVALLGTVNMDKRSFWINFEISLFAYDPAIVQDLQTLQETYLANAQLIDPAQWPKRSIPTRLTESLIQLFAPIL